MLYRPMNRSVYGHAAGILVSLYLVEAAALLMLIGIYKAPVYDRTLLYTRGGIAIVVGAFGVAAAGWLLARQTAASGSFRGRAFGLGLSTNLLSAFIAFLLVEVTTRVVARNTDDGIMVGSVLVRPTWPELREKSRNAFRGTSPLEDRDTSYFVYDPTLGWTVGHNRHSRNGLYYSSEDGVRTGGPGGRILDRSSRFRVALVGDSHAFSLEVPFGESWGYYLQKVLGSDVQVANFGVNGYGIDQMYLRYQRDVRPWSPQVVVIGFVGHDLHRTMAVYPFVSFGWPGYLVKPRFAMENQEPVLLNVPLPTPGEIFSTSRIQSLPFVQYDLGYGSAEWYWRFDGGPLFLRFLTSAVPRWPVADPRVSQETAIALNSALLTRMVTSIQETGAVALLVDLSRHEEELTRATIARARVSVLDGQKCLVDLPDALRWVPSGIHQSGPANEAIARCTALAIEPALRKSGFAPQ